MDRYELTYDEIKKIHEDMYNLISLAKPFMSDNTQTLGLSKANESLSILWDRFKYKLEPEVDEATVWTRKVLATWTLGDLKVKIACGDKDSNEDFMNVRAVMADLIASKDAEIERWKGNTEVYRKDGDTAWGERIIMTITSMLTLLAIAVVFFAIMLFCFVKAHQYRLKP